VNRQQLLQELVSRILQLKRQHPIRVALDGVDAAGKTTLADELVEPLRALGRPVIRGSIDGFHNSSIVRYQKGSLSPEGYYHDSFNYPLLREALLAPLGPNGNRNYRSAVFDVLTDSPVETSVRVADDNAVLLFDGVFLLRCELRSCWDFSIFVEADFSQTLARAQLRDVERFGSMLEVTKRYQQRYIPGQQLYLAESKPREIASVVIDNNEPGNPLIL